MNGSNQVKDFYNKLFAQAFSPDGKLLAVADRYGQITLFNLASLLRDGSLLLAEEKPTDSFFRIKPRTCPIYTLLTKDTYLMCGFADGTIAAYLWSDLEKQKANTFFEIVAPLTSSKTPLEINAFLDLDDENNISQRICSAGGDEKINLWDLETKKIVSSLSGHSDYIHCLSKVDQNSVVSGSEDGTVRFWDFRCKSCSYVFSPSDTKDCARPQRGKWIGCLAVEKDWLVCGGGPSLGFWHLGSYSLVKPLSTADVDFHDVLFYDDKVIGQGEKYALHHWNYRGDLHTSVPVSALTTFDLKVNYASNKYKVLCSCGTGSKIDVFVNLGYSSFSIDVKC